MENCKRCKYLQFDNDVNYDCGVYYCSRNLREIVDEIDVELFEKNGHKDLIPSPSWCFLKEK